MRRAVAAPHTSGVRVRNASSAYSFLKPGVTVPAVFRHWYGRAVDHVDFSYYERQGHEQDAISANPNPNPAPNPNPNP